MTTKFVDRRDRTKLRMGIASGAHVRRIVTGANSVDTAALIFEEMALIHKRQPHLKAQMIGDAPGMWMWSGDDAKEDEND